MDFREIVWDGVYGISLAVKGDMWRDLGNTVLNLLLPENIRDFLTSLRSVSF
jgi:hypothetical protein